MGIYILKPNEIEALQWDGSEQSYAEIKQMLDRRCISIQEITQDVRGEYFLIDTKFGPMVVDVNDWVVVTQDGDGYPCTPETFEQKYEQLVKTKEEGS